MNWLQSHWRVMAIGFTGFVVGAVAAAGGGKPANTTTIAHTIIDRQTDTVTVPGPIRIRTKVKMVPAPTATPARSSSQNSSETGRSFSGNGSKNLGTITVNHDSTVRWTNDGDLFQVFDDNFGFGINSQGGSGESALPAGTYSNVSVNAAGNWTLRIVA
jgi:hypothetical protein